MVPPLGAGTVYGWAHCCFTADSAPSAGIALAGGPLIAGSCAVYRTAVAGTRGFFGAVALALALLPTLAAADLTHARGEVAVCVARAVDSTVQQPSGEGGPGPRTVHRHALDCPGGYPAELKDDRGEVRGPRSVAAAGAGGRPPRHALGISPVRGTAPRRRHGDRRQPQARLRGGRGWGARFAAGASGQVRARGYSVSPLWSAVMNAQPAPSDPDVPDVPPRPPGSPPASEPPESPDLPPPSDEPPERPGPPAGPPEPAREPRPQEPPD